MNTRLDLTKERLFSVDQTTRATVKKAVDDKSPVTIQAYISDEVPREYVYVKNHFIGLLRQYDRIGGSNVQVQFVDVKPNSLESQQAKKNGVLPKVERSEVGGRTVEQEVFLGAHVSSSQGDQAVPFVDGESSIEYQLTRAIASTTNKKETTYRWRIDHGCRLSRSRTEWSVVERWHYSNALKNLRTEFRVKPVRVSDLNDYLAAEAEAASNDEKTETQTAKRHRINRTPRSLG